MPHTHPLLHLLCRRWRLPFYLDLFFATIRLICRKTKMNLYHEALFCELPAYDFDEG